MKIQNISYLYNPFRLYKSDKANQEQTTSSPLQFRNVLTSDVVSFGAKNYSADSIKNPTNHCAYCGCKLYNEAQIDSLAKEMLKDSAHRLQGDIKSILEKLEAAVRSEELTIAKQLANKEEIKFYRKFLEQANDKSFLKGEAIFEQVYGLDYDKALAELKKNLRPLTKTVDHVSPQKLNEENKDEDINLVEACYCCNHDLKEGMCFEEFYQMYPSIKENMPVDKFKYARARFSDSSSAVIMRGISAQKINDLTYGLLAQRDKNLAQANNAEYRLLELMPTIDCKIQECQEDIAENEGEIFDLKARLDSISSDDEYNAMIERQKLLQQQTQAEAELTLLRENKKNVSESKNAIESPSKKQKKQKNKLSDDEKAQKIAAYRQQLIELSQQIQQKESELEEIKANLETLDELFPTPEILQVRKNSYDAVITAYAQLAEEEERHAVLTGISSKLGFEIMQLEEEINSYPAESFNASMYSVEEQQIYARYSELFEAFKYAELHSNGTGIRAIVNRSAKQELEREMEKMADIPVVIDATNSLKRKELVAKRDKTLKEKEEQDKNLTSSYHKIQNLKKVTSKCSLQEAKEQSVEISKWIRRLNDKQNYLQIPKTIEKLEAEILYSNRTIDNLNAAKSKISNLNLVQG